MKYAVDITGTPLNANDINMKEGVSMTSQTGQKYFCTLPEVAMQSENDSDNKDEKPIDPPSLPSLLQPLYDQTDCLTKIKGWWTYELCPKRAIRQYHIEADESKGSLLTLGFYSHEFDWNNETDEAHEQHKSRHFHSQTYVNGTICDLTKKHRQVSVRYQCDENSLETYIEHVDEPFTCSYIITVRTPLICNHPYTKPPPRKQAHDITCQPVLPPHDYQMYHNHMKDHPEVKLPSITHVSDGVSKMYVYYTTVDGDGNVKPLSMQMIDMSDKVDVLNEKKEKLVEKKRRRSFYAEMSAALKKSDVELGIDSETISNDLKAFQEQAKESLPFLLDKFNIGDETFDLAKQIDELLRKREQETEEKIKHMEIYKEIAIKMLQTSSTEDKLLNLKDPEKVVLLRKVVEIIAKKGPTAEMAREVHAFISKYMLTEALLSGGGGKEDDSATLYVDVAIKRANLADADKKLGQELSKIGLGDGLLEAPGDDDQRWWNKEGQMFKDLIFNMFGGEEAKRREETKHSSQTDNYNFNLEEKLTVKSYPEKNQEEDQPKER